MQPRLSEFLDVAAKQLVSETYFMVVTFEQCSWQPLYLCNICAVQTSPKLKETVSVANNACWSIGELAVKLKLYVLHQKLLAFAGFSFM